MVTPSICVIDGGLRRQFLLRCKIKVIHKCRISNRRTRHIWNLRSFNVSAMAVRESPSSGAVKRPSCEACGEAMSLARIEPYTIGEAWYEDWMFECHCGRVVKKTKKLIK